MSALDIHFKVLENKENHIDVIGDANGRGVLPLYKHIAIVIRNDQYKETGPWDYSTEGYFKYLDKTRSTVYLSWVDKDYREKFFVSKGRKEMRFSLFTSDPLVFNWKINQIKFITVDIDDNTYRITYQHNCPSWECTEIKTNGNWHKIFDERTISIPINKKHAYCEARTVNSAGVRGPVFSIELSHDGS
ncbi:MAG: hypothetical protein GF397_02645 [Elusimicrobia bacterium]|nr:hypothetical protein [Elusimicrobiota bacterium]